MNQQNRELAEKIICEFPIFEYAVTETERLVFSDKVRYICENECPHYGHSWACPPAIPDVSGCMERCSAYRNALVFSTIAQVDDNLNFDECLAARREHEELTRTVSDKMASQFGSALALSSGCMVCDECTYPNAPCRYPQRRVSPIESHGIIIMQTAGELGMSYDCGGGLVTYFSVILF